MTMTAKLVSSVDYRRASADDAKRGLLGYVTCTFAGLLLLEGLVHRVTGTGRHALSFPGRTIRQGHRHSLYRPLNDCARRIIEDAVFAVLGVNREAGATWTDAPVPNGIGMEDRR